MQGEDEQQYRLTGTTGKRGSEADSDDGGGKRARTEDTGPSEVQCRHLLIKHKESRVRAPATVPTSSNPLNNKAEVTRPKEEAMDLLTRHLETLKVRFAGFNGALDTEADAVRRTTMILRLHFNFPRFSGILLRGLPNGPEIFSETCCNINS